VAVNPWAILYSVELVARPTQTCYEIPFAPTKAPGGALEKVTTAPRRVAYSEIVSANSWCSSALTIDPSRYGCRSSRDGDHFSYAKTKSGRSDYGATPMAIDEDDTTVNQIARACLVQIDSDRLRIAREKLLEFMNNSTATLTRPNGSAWTSMNGAADAAFAD
jgi:hypothetical protein